MKSKRIKFNVVRIRSAKHPTTKPKVLVDLIPITLWNGNATASDKKNTVQLSPGTVTRITKEVVIQTENNATLDLLVVVEKEKEKEKSK